MPNKFVRYFKEEPKIPGKGSFFASLAVNIVLLYVANNLRYMGISQLREPELVSCLWSANLFLALAIIGNFTLLLFRPAWFFYLVQTLINAAAVNAFFFIYWLYPFNLGSSTLDSIIKVILILIMVGFFLAFLIEFFRFGTSVPLPKKKPPAISPPLAHEPSSAGEITLPQNGTENVIDGQPEPKQKPDDNGPQSQGDAGAPDQQV